MVRHRIGPLLVAAALLGAAANGGFVRSAAGDAGGASGDVASYYGGAFDGQPTASGEIFDMRKLTAAHRTLPFGTRVRVTNVESGRSAVVRINDRGPFVKGRTLDLSYGAARVLGLVGVGVGPVRLEVLEYPDSAEARAPAACRTRIVHAPRNESVARRLLRRREPLLALDFRAAGADHVKVSNAAAPRSPAAPRGPSAQLELRHGAVV